MNKPKEDEEALRRLHFERMGQAISVVEPSSQIRLRAAESGRATAWVNPTSNKRSTDYQKEEPAPRTKLFVGHLTETCTREDLLRLFSCMGKVVECDVIKNYGFVHMSTPEEAEMAIKHLNNCELKGSSISVERSKSKLHHTPRHLGRTERDPNFSSNERRTMNGGQNNDLQLQRTRRILNDVTYNVSSPNSSHFGEQSNFAQNRQPQTQSHLSFQQPSVSATQWSGGNFGGPSAASTTRASMKPVMQPRSGLTDQSTSLFSGNSRYFQCPDTSSPTFNNDICLSTFLTSPIASNNPFTSASMQQHETVDRNTSIASRMPFASRSPPRSIEQVPSQNSPWTIGHFLATSANMTPNQPADLSQGPYYQLL